MSSELLLLAVGAVAAAGSTVACLYAIASRDLLKAAIASGVVSLFYAMLLFVLMAPSILIVYVPVSVALTTIMLVTLVMKTERYEAEAGLESRGVAIGVLLVSLTVATGVLLVLGGGWFGESLPSIELRKLAKVIADNAIPALPDSIAYLATYSVDVVTAVVWDYRGVDTFFESVVLFLAAISVALLLMEEKRREQRVANRARRASPIAVTVSKLLPLALVSAFAIVLASHPGGGFPGGSAIAGIIAVSIVVSRLSLGEQHPARRLYALLALACLGAVLLSLVSVTPLVLGFLSGSIAFLLQNQPKAVSPVGFPSEILGELTGGSILLLEASESILVLSSLLLALVLLVYYSTSREETGESSGGESERGNT
ncbi:MAG: MnhB domain-containing protein [Acidilobaceae archaeon]